MSVFYAYAYMHIIYYCPGCSKSIAIVGSVKNLLSYSGTHSKGLPMVCMPMVCKECVRILDLLIMRESLSGRSWTSNVFNTVITLDTYQFCYQFIVINSFLSIHFYQFIFINSFLSIYFHQFIFINLLLSSYFYLSIFLITIFISIFHISLINLFS